MGRAASNASASSKLIKKGPWTVDEDQKLKEYIEKHGACNWRTLPQNAGLQRCGKSCRLRWTNYLRPDIKRGMFSFEEEEVIIQLHSVLGNKWSAIAARLPGRTDNEIKNYWNTHIRKRLLRMGLDPVTHAPRLDHLLGSSAQLNNLSNMLFPLNHQQQQQQMMNPQLLNNITDLLSLKNEYQRIDDSWQVQADSYYVPRMHDQFRSHPSSFLEDNKKGGSTEMLPALVDDMAAGTSSFGLFNNNSNNQHLSLDSTPFTSNMSSPLNSSYTTNIFNAENEIDSVLNFEIPEGFDLGELLY